MRGTYTALAVCDILDLLTPELTEGVAEFLLSCQTYEGMGARVEHSIMCLCAHTVLCPIPQAGSEESRTTRLMGVTISAP